MSLPPLVPPSARSWSCATARTLAAAALTAAAFPLGVAAQAGHDGHGEHVSPYADMVDRAIKALSPEEVAGLEAGDGLGYALSAELNGVPGPKHALEMAEALALSGTQASALRDIEGRMRDDARALGARILELEAELDRRFAHGHASADDVVRLSVDIGRARGELRAVHLRAHLETVAVLSAEQTEAYVRMRGYGG